MDINMLPKRICWWLLVVALVVSIVFLAILSKGIKNWSRSLAPVRTIVVSGEGKAVLKPDIATISFSVISEGKDVVVLQNDNNTKINKAIDFVKKQGIDTKDIKTTGYNLSPKYQYDPKSGRSAIEGYTLTQTVTVKVRDLEKVGDVFGGLPGLGINQISGPNFEVEDINKHLRQARAEAFDDARNKAKELASLNHVRLGRVVTFNENQGGPLPPYPYFAKAVGGVAEDIVRPNVEVGSEEAKVSVSVTYEIK